MAATPKAELLATAEQAVTRVASLASDVLIAVNGTNSQQAQKGHAEILPIRHTNDPLLSTYKPLRAGRLVSVTAPSDILVPSVPHLYKLAQYPIVLHIAVGPDFSDITAVRQSGFTFLHSETLQQAQDIAIAAHALARRCGKGVIHFFDPANSKGDGPVPIESESTIQRVLGERGDVSVEDSDALYIDTGRVATLSRVDETAAGQADDATEGLKSPVIDTPANGDSTATPSATSEQSSRADSESSKSSAPSVKSSSAPVSSEDILQFTKQVFADLQSATSRSYETFEYTGPSAPESVIFIFGSTGIFVDELETKSDDGLDKIGIVTARLYRPWIASELAAALPASVTKIAVLEQIRRKTTKWGPVLLDVVMSVQNATRFTSKPLVVGYQLGYIEPKTARQALRGIYQNLNSPSPVQNLEVGSLHAPKGPATDVAEPQVESTYSKVLAQVFGDRLFVANRQGASNAGISRTTAASPEYGFGSLLARTEHRKRFIGDVQTALKSDEFITAAPKAWLTKWAIAPESDDRANKLAPDVIARLGTDGSRVASALLANKGLFYKESQWLIGSDSWAYDLGNSGVHQVLQSGANVNMLVIDTTPYSERAAQDDVRRKKDIGLYAMNYGNAYVASVAVYGSYTQVLEAMIEADKFQGPSVVVAYLPYNKTSDTPLTVLQETKKAIDIGYWPLYRWNPHNEREGLPNFTLDSEQIKKELKEFLRRDNHLTLLTRRTPKLAASLARDYGTEVRAEQKRAAKNAYDVMLEGLFGAPVTVLFASDNSNAEKLAQRLAKRATARGLKSMCMAMDDYPIEDLSNEENIVLVTSTAGQGEFPQNGRAFWEAVKDNAELDLSQINYAVFALGDSHYWPRKEDKIYYNKPGKDLDARIAFLGGKRLVSVGLGDDQEPDGYNTGYNAWEPELWKSLHVDKVEGMPEEPPPITNEDIKIASNFLRGTIAEGLLDKSTGSIAASDQQLTKFHGTYMQDDRDLRDERKAQGLEPAYSFMIRCRLDGGVATPDQWSRMDAISREHGNSTMKLTTRQTFQFHGVIKGELKPAMQAINRAMMTSLAACGDVNRNIMTSSCVTRSAYHADVHACAQLISKQLLPATKAYHEIWLTDGPEKTQVAGSDLVDEEPLYGPTYLPRKFKITIAIPPNNDTDVYAHDIGIIAIPNEKERLAGFNILVGGGMGVTHNNKKTYPRTGSMLGYVDAKNIAIVCEKIMLVQRDNGDRKNRKHARLKYTVDDMGVDVFRGKVEELLGYKFQPAKPFEFKSNVDTFGWQRDELGYNHFTMFIENGRVEDTPEFQMKTGLAEIAKVHKGEFRLTGNQHLILSNVHDDQLDEMKKMLKQYKLDNTQFSGLRLSSSACVAFPTCGLAMAESERYLPVLISKLEDCLEENGLAQDSIVMRMTGCPNGCARPWLAEVAFVGKAYGAYNMYLGGGYHGQRLNKLYRSSIEEEEILEIMKGLLGRYAKERNDGEHFGDFVIRSGIIKETTEGKNFHEGVAEDDEDEE